MIHVEQQAEHLFIGQTESGHTLLFHAENDHEVEVLTAEGDKPQGKVVMPEAVKCEGRCYTVASIGKQAFMGCKELTEVLIPDSVKTIRPEAFPRERADGRAGCRRGGHRLQRFLWLHRPDDR